LDAFDEAAAVAAKVLDSTMPNDWRVRYLERGYLFRNPIVHHLQTGYSPFAWIATITRNKLVDALRRRGRHIVVPIDEFAEILRAEEKAPGLSNPRDGPTALKVENPAARHCPNRFRLTGTVCETPPPRTHALHHSRRAQRCSMAPRRCGAAMLGMTTTTDSDM
jgi:hypothetical protein